MRGPIDMGEDPLLFNYLFRPQHAMGVGNGPGLRNTSSHRGMFQGPSEFWGSLPLRPPIHVWCIRTYMTNADRSCPASRTSLAESGTQFRGPISRTRKVDAQFQPLGAMLRTLQARASSGVPPFTS